MGFGFELWSFAEAPPGLEEEKDGAHRSQNREELWTLGFSATGVKNPLKP